MWKASYRAAKQLISDTPQENHHPLALHLTGLTLCGVMCAKIRWAPKAKSCPHFLTGCLNTKVQTWCSLLKWSSPKVSSQETHEVLKKGPACHEQITWLGFGANCHQPITCGFRQPMQRFVFRKPCCSLFCFIGSRRSQQRQSA